MRIELIGLFIASWFGVKAYRRYAIRCNVLDVPNARSSHTSVTPRGGGVVFVILSLLWLAWNASANTWLSMIVPAALIALISFWDDHRPLSPKVRLLIQSIAVIIMLSQTGLAPIADFLPLPLAAIIVTLGFLWSINLFNFMDLKRTVFLLFPIYLIG